MRYRLGGLIFGGAYIWRGLFSEFYGKLTIIDRLLYMGYSFLQLSPEEEIEVRSYLAAIEIGERRKDIEREEKELKGKEERLKQKSKEIKNTVIEPSG